MSEIAQVDPVQPPRFRAQIIVEDRETGRTYYADVDGEVFDPASSLTLGEASYRHLVPAVTMLRDAIKGSARVRRELVPNDQAVHQSGRAKTYQCPECKGPVFSQYEGDEPPTIHCGSLGHVLEWWPS